MQMRSDAKGMGRVTTKDSLDNAAAAVAIAGGTLGLLFAFVKFVRWGHRVLRQLDRIAIIWYGDASAEVDDDARHGLVHRLRAMERRLDRIENQVTKNGGSSMADAVDRIARKQGVLGVGETGK